MDPELQHFYDSLEQFVLSEAELRSNGYPLWDENSKELVVIKMDHRERDSRPFLDDDLLERTCGRCREKYVLTGTGDQAADTKCKYHWRKMDNELRFPCCNRVWGWAAACVEENHHVSDSLKKGILREFIETPPPKESYTCPGVYAMDCEMVYTAWGPALGRVTLLDYQGVVVLDEIVRPNERLLDTNFRYSGLKQEEVENAKYNFNQVREKFFQFVNSKSILIGHSLENDLRFLKVVHQKVVDTAMVWQHPRGSHLKWRLRDLVKTMLNKDIQAGDAGHDSKEDAMALWYFGNPV
ncbi:putative RNA exonuclease pqe-1 [Ditylenchus destructor]|nr:putative RNA exonuclease pqe-1 [Ditylenchus destructor]